MGPFIDTKMKKIWLYDLPEAKEAKEEWKMQYGFS